MEEKIFDDGRPDYIMSRNLRVAPQFWGLELPMMSCGHQVSSQRANMYATSMAQALITNGVEMPQVASGCEKKYMKYTFNNTRFQQNGLTLATIPKFRVNVGTDPISYCPQYLLIYLGEEDDMVHSMLVSNYYLGTNGFGWKNKINRALLAPNTYIKKGTVIASSDSVQGSKYCMGVNVNTAYATFPNTVEDAIWISDAYAKKLVATGYRTLIIDVHKDMVPLNKYGDDLHYRFLPELGMKIGDDGIVCGFRRVDPLTYFSDFAPSSLCTYQPLNDDLYFCEPGATVVDIDVVENPSKKVTTPDYVFQQIEKYKNEAYHYYEKIIQTYNEECVKKSRRPGPEFNNLVKYAYSYLFTSRKRVGNLQRKSLVKFKKKDIPISFIQIKIVLKYDIVPSLGSKLTCRSANKGVISKITPQKHMPVNEDGVYADMVISSMAIPNRMNPAQIYETFISCLCDKVLKKMREQSDPLEAYYLMLELFYDINPAYGDLTDKSFSTDEMRIKFAKEAMDSEYLIVIVPPFLDNIVPEWVIEMRDKYQIKATPVSYDILDKHGKVVRRVTTKRPVFIGKKYAYLLCKVPFCKSSGLGFVNQWGIPITVKDSVTKSMTPVSQTPIRTGEDEIRNLSTSMGQVLACRILNLYANAPEMTMKLADDLLVAEYPTRYQFLSATHEEIQKNSRCVSAMQSMMSVCGIDLKDPIVLEDETC